MNASRYMTVCVILLLGISAAAARANDFVVVHDQGVIVKLDLAKNTALIDGLVYRFAPDARVEIAGSFGAFTMLAEGMKVEYVYRRYSDEDREVIAMRQLPDSTVLEPY